MCRLHKKFGDKAQHCSPQGSREKPKPATTVVHREAGKSLSQQPKVTRCVGRLIFVRDYTNDIRFLVDSETQIYIIPATETDKKKGPHKLTLQAVNKSLITTYGLRCLTLNLGLRRVFTHIFCGC